MWCLTCHYSLAGLADHRCPECGREFDPDDVTTFTTREWERQSTVVLMILWALFLLVFGVPLVFSLAAYILSNNAEN